MRKGLLLSAVFGLALLAISGCGGGGGGSAGASGGGTGGGTGGGGSAPSACPANPIIGTDNQLAGSAIAGNGALASGMFFTEQIASFIVLEGYDDDGRKIKDNLCTSGSMTHNLDISTLTLTASFNNCSFSYEGIDYTVNYTVSGSLTASIGEINDCGYIRSLSAPNMTINVRLNVNNQTLTTTLNLTNFSYSVSDAQMNSFCDILRGTITINQGSKVVSTSNNQQVEALAVRNVVASGRLDTQRSVYASTYSGQFYVKTGCVDACVSMQTQTPVDQASLYGDMLYVSCPARGEMQFSAGNRTVSVKYAQDGLYINNQKVSDSCVIPACMR